MNKFLLALSNLKESFINNGLSDSQAEEKRVAVRIEIANGVPLYYLQGNKDKLNSMIEKSANMTATQKTNFKNTL